MSGTLEKTAIVADDHQIIRSGLVSIINRQRGVLVVGEAVNGLEAVSLAKKFKPDLLTLDIAMPYAQGIVVYNEIKRWPPQTSVAVFSVSPLRAALRTKKRPLSAEDERDDMPVSMPRVDALCRGGGAL